MSWMIQTLIITLIFSPGGFIHVHQHIVLVPCEVYVITALSSARQNELISRVNFVFISLIQPETLKKTLIEIIEIYGEYSNKINDTYLQFKRRLLLKGKVSRFEGYLAEPSTLDQFVQGLSNFISILRVSKKMESDFRCGST